MNELVTMEQAEEFAVLDRRDARSVFAMAGYVPKPNSRETMLEQLHNAGLNFPVETTPLFANLHGTMQRADAYVAVRNATSGAVFSVAKEGYQPLQWSTMDVLQPVVDAGLGSWDGVLRLRGGALGVGRVRLVQDIVVPGDESPLFCYLNVCVPHDKTIQWMVFASLTRPVCENTFKIALREAKGSGYVLKVRHTRSAEDKVATARKVLDASMRRFAMFNTFAQRAVRTTVSDRQFGSMVERLLPAKHDAVSPQLGKARDKLHTLWAGEARGLRGIQGTAWGAYNTITEYADHYQRVRGDASNRADSILFGRAAELKANAVDVIEEIVGELV